MLFKRTLGAGSKVLERTSADPIRYDAAESFRERAVQIYGHSLVDTMLEVEESGEGRRVSGLVGRPELSRGTRDRQLSISVADRGPGVPRADRERVFEPYYRVPTGDRHDVKGHGLGLSYVRLVARAHGGRVWLEDNAGGGTLAVLRIPLARGGNP